MDCVAECFDGNSSKKTQVSLNVNYQSGLIKFNEGSGAKSYSVAQLSISPRLGTTPRRIETPDGWILEVSDNDVIDRLVQLSHGGPSGGFLHRFESKFRFAFVGVIITVGFIWFFAGYGIPFLARHVAFLVPVEANAAFGRGSLKVLDQLVLSGSQLDTARKEEISHLFASMSSVMPAGYQFNLVFRKGERIGANALALPAGTIILTDELVNEAIDLHEIELVLAHEIGHIVHRHALRALLQDSTVALLMVAVTGDVSSIALVAGALPTWLVEAHYSREFEIEADQFAYDYATTRGIPPRHFINILDRISNGQGDAGFLSTHPSAEDRNQIFSQH